MSVLEVHSLSVEVAGLSILEGLTFSLRRGDKVGVVGRNGAGKTSLLKVLAGEAQPLAGTVRGRGALGYLRQDPRQHRADEDHTGLAHVLQARGLLEMAARLEKERTGLEEHPTEARVARFTKLEERYRAAGGYSGEAEVRRMAHGLGLAQDRLDLPVPALSGGERRRLELTRILFAGSDVLLLDEPTRGIDVGTKYEIYELIDALAREGKGIVLVSSELPEVLGMADRVVVMCEGRVSAVFEREDATQEAVLAAALPVEEPAA